MLYTIQQNESDANKREIPFILADADTGVFIEGASGIIARIRKPGESSYSTASGTILEVGSGTYIYQSTVGDVDSIPTLLMQFSASGSIIYNAEVEIQEDTQTTLGNNLTIAQSGIDTLRYQGAVHIDTSNGTNNTAFPFGTPEFPTSSMANGLTIADDTGLNIIKLRGAVILASDSPQREFVGVGESLNSAGILISDTSVDVTGCRFIHMIFNGTVIGAGDIELEDCLVGTVGGLTGFEGRMRNCGIGNTISPSGTTLSQFHLYDCFAAIDSSGSAPVLDFASASGTALTNMSINGFNGPLKITNFIDSSLDLSANFDSGILIIDGTCTAGTITVGGDVTVINNASGTTVITPLSYGDKRIVDDIILESGVNQTEHDATQALITSASGDISIAQSGIDTLRYQGAVHVDSSGTASTTFPFGTPEFPTNSLANGKTILDNTGLNTMIVRGLQGVSVDLENVEIIGVGENTFSSAIAVIGTPTFDETKFSHIAFSGNVSNSDVQFDNCRIINISNFRGIMRECLLEGSIFVGSGTGDPIVFENCSSAGASSGALPRMVFDSASDSLTDITDIVGYNGILKISDLTESGHTVNANFDSGLLTIDSSCTAGTIIVTGDVKVTDESAGATVITHLSYGDQSINDNIILESVVNQTEHDFTQAEIVALSGVTVAEHDATQAMIILESGVNQTEHDATQSFLTAESGTNQNEHDQTQLDIAALQSSVDGIENSVRVQFDVPKKLLRPDDTPTKDYRFELLVFSGSGTGMEDADSLPTIEIRELNGTVASSGTFVKPSGTTGQYYFDYTVASGDTLEVLRAVADVVENTENITVIRGFEIVNTIDDQLDIIESKIDDLDIDVAGVQTSIILESGVNQTEHDFTQAQILAASGSIGSSAVIADAVWDEARSAHTTSGSFGEAIRLIKSGTAQAGAATTITLDTGASTINSFYNNQIIHLISGTGAGQSRRITAYTGSTRLATVDLAWSTNPNATTRFLIYPDGRTAPLVTNAISAASIAGAAITSAKIAADAIGASQIAADAIGSSELATTAVNEIADAVWDELAASHTTIGSMGELQNNADLILTDTAALDARLTTARAGYLDNLNIGDFVAGSGQVESNTADIQSDIAAESGVNQTEHDFTQSLILATSGELPTAVEIADAVWDEAIADHTASGTTGEALNDISVVAGSPSAIADAVWDEALVDHTTAGTMGGSQNLLDDIESDTSSLVISMSTLPADVADAVWDETIAGHLLAGAAGRILNDIKLDTTSMISSILLLPSGVADQVWDEQLSGHLGAGTTGEALEAADDLTIKDVVNTFTSQGS